jgi:hypothetical protein
LASGLMSNSTIAMIPATLQGIAMKRGTRGYPLAAARL